jgi:hypothetical protein
MEYTAKDYNVTIKRGFVHEDGRILHAKNEKLIGGLEWKLPKAWNKDKKRRKKNQKTRYQLHKSRIDDIKLEHGCEVCGFGKHKYAKKWRKHVAMLLEFDHIDPATKLYNVGEMAQYAWDVIQTEIDKCRVVCKVCHCKHTGNQNRKDDAA